MHLHRLGVFVVRITGVMVLMSTGAVFAQQLEPRAYAPSPIDVTVSGLAATYSTGEVAIDPSVPITDAEADVILVAPYIGRSFALFDKHASFSLVVPVANIDGTGELRGERDQVNITGVGDPILRLAVNLMGSLGLTPQEFATRERETILGASLSVVAP